MYKLALAALAFIAFHFANAAFANNVPILAGDCVETSISLRGPRLENLPDSGTSILYANGVYNVDYSVIEAVRASEIGDPVTLCLVSVPQGCPEGDDRGKVYAAVNHRLSKIWQMADSSHVCGGA